MYLVSWTDEVYGLCSLLQDYVDYGRWGQGENPGLLLVSRNQVHSVTSSWSLAWFFIQRPLEFLVIVMFTGQAFALYVLPNEVWKTGREWKNVPICWEGSKLLFLNSHNTCRISGIRKELKIMKKKSTYKSQWGLVGYGLLRQWLPSFALWMGPNEFCAGLSAWNALFNWLFQFLSKNKNGSDCDQL